MASDSSSTVISATWIPIVPAPTWPVGGESSIRTVGTLMVPDLHVSGWSGFTLGMDKSRYDASLPPLNGSVTPPLTITGQGHTLATSAGTMFSGPVATFSISDTTLPITAFTPTIDWNDGKGPIPADATMISPGTISVSGSHTYMTATPVNVPIQITTTLSTT
jgi:hypothetical protein